MVTKRNIREELKELSKKEMLKILGRVLSFTFKTEPIKTSIYVLISLIHIAVPIYSLFLLQELINLAVKGTFDKTLLITFLLVALINLVLVWVKPFLKRIFSTTLRIKANANLYQKLNILSIQDFESNKLHNNFNRSDLASAIIPGYFLDLLNMLVLLITSVSYFLIIFSWKPILILIILPFPLFYFVLKYKKLKENFIEWWELSEKMVKKDYYSKVMREQRSLTEIKLLNANDSYLDKYNENYKKIENKRLELNLKYMKQDFIIDCINEFLSNAIFVYLIIELVRGNILIGNFNTYRTATSQSLIKLNQLSENLADINVDLIEIREYFNFMDYETKFKDGTTKINTIDTIEFKNVSFSYPSSKDQALKNVSFKVQKGEKIAFIGENGSGKTTIMKLILNVYHPTKGEVLINGITTTKIDTTSLRNNTSMLLQDFNLFEETVRENIALGTDEQDSRKIYSKIPFEDLKTRIKRLDKKLNTVLGSWFGDGINFSKGQVQKLALSRIFYRDTDCIILDEPNSALDPRAEKFLFDYIDKKVKNKICISTLHVFTNIDIMDRIIMFDKGHIIAEGSHKELYNKSKEYTEFYNLQEKPEEKKK